MSKTKDYSYHKHITEDLVWAINDNCVSTRSDIDVYDMKDSVAFHEMFAIIENHKADIIINLDLVGFDLITGNQTLSLNALPIRCVNLLFKSSNFYKEKLKLRQNLSMFTYFSARDDIEFDEKLKESIPNPGKMCEYDYMDNSEEMKIRNRQNLSEWIHEQAHILLSGIES